MESARRKNKVVALPSDSHTVWDLVQKYGNAAATVLLLAAAVYFIVRWRMNSADAARNAMSNELSMARTMVMSLEKSQFERSSPQMLAATRDQTSAAATAAITNVLNGGGDAAQRAAALIARGDLNWNLANLPELPGAATQPALRSPEDPSLMLGKAESAYQQVLSDSLFSDQKDALASAHLGLAAIAENRGDWAKAKAQLQAVIDKASDTPVAATLAQQQLTAMPMLMQPIPLVTLAPPALPKPFTPLLPTTQMSSMGKPATRASSMPAK